MRKRTVRKDAPRAHASQHTHSSCTRWPLYTPRLRRHKKAWLRPLTLQGGQEGLVCPGRGGWPEGGRNRPLLHLFLAPSTPWNSPSRQAQDVQEGETDPEGRRDRGYLFGRNHLCNMPYFKTVHVSRLSRCPEKGARRGQRLSAACAHSRSHSPALSQPEPRWARVCTRARGRRNLPFLAPSFSSLSSQCLWRAIYTAQHPFVPAL